MPYEHKNAYRHENSEVEGFVGIGNTKAKAKADASEQILRKIVFRHAGRDGDCVCFDRSRVIESPSRLTPEELSKVQTDWRSGLRY